MDSTNELVEVCCVLVGDWPGSNVAYRSKVADLGAHYVIQLKAMLDISHHLTTLTPGQAFMRGVPAGFILATIAWLLPNARGQEIWIITLLTWLISLAGFSHVIAGSAEAWLLATSGQASYGFAMGGFILPALGGNIVGGTGLFAVLAHAQVRSEL